MENGRSRLLNHGRSCDSGVITAPWESFPLSTGWFPERKTSVFKLALRKHGVEFAFHPACYDSGDTFCIRVASVDLARVSYGI